MRWLHFLARALKIIVTPAGSDKPLSREEAKRHADYDDLNNPVPPPRDEEGPPAEKPLSDEEVLAKIEKEYDRLSDGGIRPWPGGIERLPNVPVDSALQEQDDKRWDRVLLAFDPHPDVRRFSHTIKNETFIDDASGTPIAIVQGDHDVFLGGFVFVTVFWMTTDPIARRVARVRGAPWLNALSANRELFDSDHFPAALHEQVRLHTESGYLAPEYARVLYHSLLGERKFTAAQFFKRLPPEKDGDLVFDPERNEDAVARNHPLLRSMRAGHEITSDGKGNFFVDGKLIWPLEKIDPEQK